MKAIHRAVIKLYSAPHRDKTSPNLVCVPQRDFNGSPRHGCDSSQKPYITVFGLYLVRIQWWWSAAAAPQTHQLNLNNKIHYTSGLAAKRFKLKVLENSYILMTFLSPLNDREAWQMIKNTTINKSIFSLGIAWQINNNSNNKNNNTNMIR